MKVQRYPEEFKIEAVKQILEHGHSVADVSRRIGVSTHSLYKWIKLQQMPATQRHEQVGQSEELRRLKAELKRVTEERYPKKGGLGFNRSRQRLLKRSLQGFRSPMFFVA